MNHVKINSLLSKLFNRYLISEVSSEIEFKNAFYAIYILASIP